MATYFTLTEEAANRILGHHQLGRMIGQPREIRPGLANSLFELRTTNGPYILKVYEPSFNPFKSTPLERRHNFQRYCKMKGVPVAALVSPLGTVAIGDPQGATQKRFYEIFEKIRGHHPRALTPKQARNIGRMLGDFHNATHDLTTKYAEFADPPPSIIRIAAHEAASSFKRIFQHHGISDTEARYFDMLTHTTASYFTGVLTDKNYISLPQGNIHGDINAGNILIGHHNQPYLLDLETVRRGPLIVDVAQGILRLCNCWISPDTLVTPNDDLPSGMQLKELNKELVAAFLTGYNAARKLGPDEVAMLPKAICDQAHFLQIGNKKLEALNIVHNPLRINARILEYELNSYDFKDMIKRDRTHFADWVSRQGKSPRGGSRA